MELCFTHWLLYPAFMSTATGFYRVTSGLDALLASYITSAIPI